jgi:hypothetical protein
MWARLGDQAASLTPNPARPVPCLPEHAAGSEEDGDSIAHHQRARMVYLEPAPAVKLHGEDVEGLQLPDAVKNGREVVSRHAKSPREVP